MSTPDAPRRFMLTPLQVQQRYFLDDEGQPVRDTEWICKHVRPRIDLARGVVRFYADDVEAWLASRVRAA